MIESKELPYKMAAYLIAESKKQGIESSVLDPGKDETLDQIISGAKKAEAFLDVPLKDRPREPFSDSIPNHLDKPLRSLVGFIDDGLPEYSAFKFWETRKSMPLNAKIQDIISMDAYTGKQNTQIDPRDIVENLKLPQTDPKIDALVLNNLSSIAKTLKDGIPYGFRTEAIPEIFQETADTSYELIARMMGQAQRSQQPASLDPAKVADIVMSSAVLGPGIQKIATEFPMVFSAFLGMSAIPQEVMERVKGLQSEVKGPLNAQTLFQAMQTGSVNLINISEINEGIIEASARANGFNPQDFPKIKSDIKTAASQPFMSALTTKSEALARQEFQAKKSEVRQKLALETQKALSKPSIPTQPEAPQGPKIEDGIHQVHEDGVSMTVIPEHLAYIDPDPEDPEPKQGEPTVEERGWKRDGGRNGVFYYRDDDLVVMEASGTFKAFRGHEFIGEFETPQQAVRALEA